jgi:hypothetical protein
MRNFIDIAAEFALCEAVEIPDTDYGYWIKPDGEIVVVPYSSSHESTLRRASGGEMWTYGKAFRFGWVRVVLQNIRGGKELIVNTNTAYMSTKALFAVMALARLPGVVKFQADVGEEYKEFTEDKAFVAFVRQQRKPMPVTE